VSVTRRQRTLSATPQRVWEVIEDPHHLPRWWPGVTRMEGIVGDRFTQVHMTKRGRPVRLDFRVLQSDPPRQRTWEQELDGTPFARVLGEAITEITLEPVQSGTRVTLIQRHKLRGYSRTGAFLLARATAKRLVEALERLEEIA
jgi:uncharacterized protein YndB with AHSA1/START domain